MRGLLLIATLCSVATPALAGEAKRSTFGTLSDGRPVAAVTLTNRRGVAVRLITLGASIQSVLIPDGTGKPVDIAVGYDSIEGYEKAQQYFGATVGRVANRIAKGRFTLDGHAYQVPVNNGPNSLHGGTSGFDKALWTIADVTSGPAASVTMTHVSADGDQGYPGTVTAKAVYTLDDQDRLTISYSATTDRATLVNLSNHAYWNLAGPGRSAMDHLLTIPADRYTPTDETAIPTGVLAPVAGTPFDFRTPRAIGERVRDGRDPQIRFGRGYDHNWVIGDRVTADTHLMARVTDPASGRGLELWSNQPGLQFYSGNFLDGTTKGKSDQIYREGDAIVLEPQIFPDAPNQPAFPSIRLAPGETYRNIIVYKFLGGRP